MTNPPRADPGREAEPVIGGAALPLRGCDHLLAEIDAAIDGLLDGRPGVVLIEGSAGYGKSRLLAEAAERARRAGVRVVTGGAEPDDRGSPFATLLAALSGDPSPVLSREEVLALEAVGAGNSVVLLTCNDAVVPLCQPADDGALGSPTPSACPEQQHRRSTHHVGSDRQRRTVAAIALPTIPRLRKRLLPAQTARQPPT